MFEHLIENPMPLATFLMLAIAGLVAGRLAIFLKIPDITGHILVGILLGPSVLAIFSHHALHDVKIITEIALGVMTFIAGTHLSFKKLHNASRRVFAIAFCDAVLTFWIVLLVLSVFGVLNLSGRLLLASIAIATAPGTIVGLIQTKKARGVLVKTLIGVVALNNVAAILAFELCKVMSVELLSGESFEALRFLGFALLSFVEDLALGFAVGGAAALVAKHQHEESGLFSTILVSILLNVVVCQYLHLSTLLVCMATGVTFSNLSYHSRRVSHILEGFNGLIFCVFFTLAGTHLDLSILSVAGFGGLLYVVSRFVAKVVAVQAGSRLSKVSPVISRYLAMCLIPQAGLAIGLVISLNEFEVFVSSGLAAAVAAITLASVVVNELVGPFTTGRAFDLAHESGEGSPRLIDFLHEEYILVPLETTDKWDAIEKMCRFLVMTNHLRSVTFEALHQSVVDREKQLSTGMGHQLAIPHARIPAKEHLMGVIGILSDPLDFEALDGEKISVIILVATPEGKEDLHLKVLGAISKIFVDDPAFIDHLTKARDAAEAFDVLQSVDIQEINYFMDENI
ncbi:MAG: PTS sugar transporter subunit IIA [Lentisphaerae bacterium]|nr:PTS sugar transporter subunit IIA [Lentisphaerota bacterium]